MFSDDGEEDYEQEALKQSISRISSQMAKLSSIIIETVWEDDCSGKFSSYPIDVADLTRHSNDSVPEASETVAYIYKHVVTDKEVAPSDTDVVATDPEVTQTDNSVQDPDVVPPSTEVTTADPEVATTSADHMGTSVDNQPINHKNIPSSPDGSTTFLEDLPVESKANTSTPRIKSKTSKIRSFFQRKTKKEQRKDRYMESAV